MNLTIEREGHVAESVLGRTVKGKVILKDEICEGTIIAATYCICTVECLCGKVVNVEWNEVTFTDHEARGRRLGDEHKEQCATSYNNAVRQINALRSEINTLTGERDALASICAEVIEVLGIVNDDNPAHLPNHAADVSADKNAGWNAWRKEASERDEIVNRLHTAVRKRDAAVEALKLMLRRHGCVEGCCTQARAVLANIGGGQG